MLCGVTMLKARNMLFAFTPNAQLQPIRKRVHNRHAHAVQTTRHLVGIAVEFTARVQLGHDDLGRRDAFFFVQTHRNAPAVVAHRNTAVGVDFNTYVGRMSGQRLIDPVVHHLVDHVVQTGAIIGIPDVHAGPLAHSLQAFENFDRIGAVCFRRLSGVSHVDRPLVWSATYSGLPYPCHAQTPTFSGLW